MHGLSVGTVFPKWPVGVGSQFNLNVFIEVVKTQFGVERLLSV